jgi:hypothetical protein
VDRAGTGQREAAAILGRFALGGPGEAGHEDRRGVGLGQRGRVEGRGPPGRVQDGGGTRTPHPPRVRQAGGRRGARTAPGRLPRRARLGAMAAGPRELCVPGRRGGRPTRARQSVGDRPRACRRPGAPRATVGPRSARQRGRRHRDASGAAGPAPGRGPTRAAGAGGAAPPRGWARPGAARPPGRRGHRPHPAHGRR